MSTMPPGNFFPSRALTGPGPSTSMTAWAAGPRLIGADGSRTEYAWAPTGYLNSTIDRTPDGMETSRHELWVDALGTLRY